MAWAFDQTTLPMLKFVLVALADHADDEGVCWPGLLGLARKTSLTRRTLLRHLNTLKRLGLVKVEPRHDRDGRQRSNLYRLPVTNGGEGVTRDTPGCHQCHREGVKTDTGEGVTCDTQNHKIEPSDESTLSSKPDSPSSRSDLSPKSPSKPNQSVDRNGDAVLDVFAHWQQVHNHPGAKLDDNRKRTIKARLRDGYSVENLKQAVDGCKRSSWHMGANDRNTVYDSLDLILRNAEKVDAFMELATSKRHAEGLPSWV